MNAFLRLLSQPIDPLLLSFALAFLVIFAFVGEYGAPS